MTKNVVINKKKIGPGESVFVIAEVGINHNGDLKTAIKLIDEARRSGADAVKLQTYITEKRVPKDSPIFGILKQCELSFDDQKKLFDHARENGIEIFSTPFDNESVDFLASINSPCFKIASFDVVNKKLLERVSSKGKPVIISRGMADQGEVDTAVGIVRKFDAEVILLHCVSAYPVPSPAFLNLNTIRALEARYSCPAGFSDHTVGPDASAYAVLAGASVIEKHFTLSTKSEGPDHALSMEPEGLKELVRRVRAASEMMGTSISGPLPIEAGILQYRRKS